MNIQAFVENVESIYKTGAATKHSYRADLQKLLSSIAPDIIALNEPKRVECGAPDFIVSQGDIVIGHVEAKNIPVDIRALKDSNKDQRKRYLAALPNLIYTNCFNWDFYRELVASVNIADSLMGVQPPPAGLHHPRKPAPRIRHATPPDDHKPPRSGRADGEQGEPDRRRFEQNSAG